MMNKPYYRVQCPKCGRWQPAQEGKVECRYCKGVFKYKHGEEESELDKYCDDRTYTKNPLIRDRLGEAGFNDGQILTILKTVAGVCKYCWNGETGCYCMADE
jgi:hypothetical protein